MCGNIVGIVYTASGELRTKSPESLNLPSFSQILAVKTPRTTLEKKRASIWGRQRLSLSARQPKSSAPCRRPLTTGSFEVRCLPCQISVLSAAPCTTTSCDHGHNRRHAPLRQKVSEPCRLLAVRHVARRWVELRAVDMNRSTWIPGTPLSPSVVEMDPFHSAFPQNYPPAETLDEVISEREANEIHDRSSPDGRGPNVSTSTPQHDMTQPPLGDQAAVSVRNDRVPLAADTGGSRTERHVPRSGSPGGSRNRNSSAANRRRRVARPTTTGLAAIGRQAGGGTRNRHSRFCHLCNKRAPNVEHPFLCKEAGCWKALCSKCMDKYRQRYTGHQATFECPHHRNLCGEITNKPQCFRYNRVAENRRAETQRRRANAEVRAHQVRLPRAEVVDNRTAPHRSAGFLGQNGPIPQLRSAPLQDSSPQSFVLATLGSSRLPYPQLNLSPVQAPYPEVIDDAALLDPQPGTEPFAMDAAMAEEYSWEPVFD